MREQLDQCYLYATQEVTTIEFGYRTVFGCLQKSYIPLCVRLYAENSWESTTNDAHTVEVGNLLPQSPCCAFEVDLEDLTTVIFALNAPSARMAAVREWRAAGFVADGRWPCPLKARRMPCWDRAARVLKPRQAYSESYVRELC